MIIARAPLRISFFGGSTDYESFYKEHGSFVIGTTIDKYVWLAMKYKQGILPREHSIRYSKLEVVPTTEDIQNPLIRETLKYFGIRDHVDFTSSADVPARTGLGGSSSFCAGMVHLLTELKGGSRSMSKKDIARTAIHIERNILKDSGGIQDQIWAAYGGFNTIKIERNGNFIVKPVSVSAKFRQKFEDSILLIYTNFQRDTDVIAQSHENKDKKKILDLSRTAYGYFLKEDIKKIGELLLEAWNEKRKISNLISTGEIDKMVDRVMELGAYGIKLLGSGGCGFLMAICSPAAKKRIMEEFKENILEFTFEDRGTSILYKN